MEKWINNTTEGWTTEIEKKWLDMLAAHEALPEGEKILRANYFCPRYRKKDKSEGFVFSTNHRKVYQNTIGEI
jgi:hypothetical protein